MSAELAGATAANIMVLVLLYWVLLRSVRRQTVSASRLRNHAITAALWVAIVAAYNVLGS